MDRSSLSRGRHGADKRAASERMRREMTPAEAVLWQQLRGNRLGDLHFRRQQIIDGFIVDFYCYAARLVVEVDGAVHADQTEYDTERDRILSARNLRVLRLTNDQVLHDLPSSLRAIQTAARQPQPDQRVTPSPRWGGGRGVGKTLVLIPGDGIGHEVVPAVADVLRMLLPGARFVEAEAGFGAYERHGTPLPDATLAACRDVDAILFGAVTTPPDIPGYRSPILRLRKELSLAANLRPVRSLPIPTSRPGVDLLIVRENTEGMYSGIEEVSADGERATTLRVITGEASRRVAHTAFRLARERRGRCTVVHKANVLRQTDGLFRRAVREVAAEYPDVALDELLVDTAALRLAQQPEAFDVLVTTNLFGDILSDLAAAHIGGLGVAASANVGGGKGLFEPVHGSAPDIVGRGIANPTATFLASVLMLRHLGEHDAATRLERATEATLAAGIRTPDLGGTATTTDVCRAISAALEEESLAH